MEGVGRLLRGLRARGAASAIIFVVALVAVAAAATGPTFATAAEAAILADTLHDAPVVAQGVELSFQGPVRDLDAFVGIADEARRGSGATDLFPTRVRAQETTFAPADSQQALLAWRDGACEHLRISPGRCPAAAGEAVVSRAAAARDGFTVGGRVPGTRVPLTVVGIYEPVDAAERFWSVRGYFPQAGGQSTAVGSRSDVELLDAVLTVPATFAGADREATAVTLVHLPVALDAVRPDDVPRLRDAIRRMGDPVARGGGSLVTSLPAALDDAAASTRVLQVPVVLITVQLLVPVWLLLFLAIADAAEARAPDVALSSLRGHSRLRTLAFGLAETVSLLLAALPLGVLAGWAATSALARAALRPGTPVTLPPTAALAAVGALSAGLLAAGLAGWRAVRRPVLEQWRRTQSARARRGWVVEVAVLVAAAAGIAELYASGAVGSASTHVLALLVPGLVGLAVAVAAARLLPWACRRTFRVTGRRGGLAAFLAVRQVTRRPAGLRTVLLLTTSFALATFAVASWTVATANTAAVAATRVGAATVLDVLPAAGEDLATTVARLDPRGRAAMAVDVFDDNDAQERRTVAVDSRRYAAVAYWRPDFGPRPVADLARRLRPASPEPVTLPGDRVRITVTGTTGVNPVRLRAGLKVPAGHAVTPLDLGTVPAGTVRSGPRVLEAPLPAGPSVLRTLVASVLDPTGVFRPVDAASGELTVTDVQTRVGGAWRPVAAGLTGGGPWRGVGQPTSASFGEATPTPEGLHLTWQTVGGGQIGPEIVWTANGFPTPLPALVTPDVAALPRSPDRTVAGLDGAALAVEPVSVGPVPGAPTGGAVVDRDLALRAGYDDTWSATHQVWLAAGAPQAFRQRLAEAGVRVVAERTAAGAEAVLRRQGPALAQILFVADSCVAALLAVLGAVAGLHLAGRRRRYELSALLAAGCRRRTLRAALWLEQLAVLGSGLLGGAAAGAIAARMALPAVPEFVEVPVQPALLYTPTWGQVAALLAAVGVATALACVASGATLVAGTRPEQLRESAA